MQSQVKCFLVFVLNLLAIELFHCHPKGAPTSVCHDLTPKHMLAGKQSSPSPFTLTTHAINASHIHFTIEGSDEHSFRGFIIQARRVNASHEAIGKFVADDEDAHTINCFSQAENTITHSNRKDKKKVSATWVVPKSLEPETEIVFVGTIVKTYSEFWTDLSSKPVKMSGNSYGADVKKVEDDSMFSLLLTLIGDIVSGN